ncbi:LysR substrate-binding domain-containing protein [Saccharopolyspora sp. K220]|uniref:LysR family transcriptional regulator n=1 Tax=Saccharopolyspora soli TaxID=2926618 RepID=UPI001F580E08|nr:LysR substrate-binding domain-containing protein [Saccharopolyspora soli]MCI2424074.1 LysR substrate-binding domain-containing protein [Saccharopolyspora soli]
MSDAPSDLDLRLVRYFTVVAEHRHFGKAADALRIAQPSLSRQIRRLEQQLGARLLDRTPRGTALTEAGEAFLPRAKALLRSATRAAATARAAARPNRIVIGYTSGLIVTPAAQAMRKLHPDADVHTQHFEYHEPRAALLDRRADAVVTRLPFSTDGLRVTLLYEEPRAVVVSREHRLASKKSVTLDDIADEPMPRIPGADATWSAYWRLEPRPDGSSAPDGPIINALEDKFEVVAAGEAVAIAVGAAAHLRPDLVAIPLEGVEPSHVVLATRAGERSRLVADFTKLAEELLTGPPRD